MDSRDERRGTDGTGARGTPQATVAYGVSDSAPPDYRAIARQFATLSAAAARHARATGNGDLDRLARRLDDCADAILDDLDRDHPGAPGSSAPH